jgi:hypothetical protein
MRYGEISGVAKYRYGVNRGEIMAATSIISAKVMAASIGVAKAWHQQA